MEWEDGPPGDFDKSPLERLSAFPRHPDMFVYAIRLALHALLLGPVIIAGFVMLWLTHVSLSQVLGIGDTQPVENAPSVPQFADNTTER